VDVPVQAPGAGHGAEQGAAPGRNPSFGHEPLRDASDSLTGLEPPVLGAAGGHGSEDGVPQGRETSQDQNHHENRELAHRDQKRVGPCRTGAEESVLGGPEGDPVPCAGAAVGFSACVGVGTCALGR